jgi:hypothetical protein
MGLHKVKLLLLSLVVETSRYVALYVQVPGADLTPNCIGSLLFMPHRVSKPTEQCI